MTGPVGVFTRPVTGKPVDPNEVRGNDNTLGAALNTLDGEVVKGPASSTDNAVALFDGTTGKLVKNSVVIAAAGAVSGITTLTTSGAINGQTISSAASFTGTVNVTGNLTVDTDTLFVDAANNRVGIGTTSPAYSLSVVGAAVGTPSASFTQSNSVNSGSLLLGGTTYGALITRDSLGADQDLLIVNSHGGAQGFKFRTGSTTAGTTDLMVLTGSGNLGIGITPSAWSLKTLQIGSGGWLGTTAAADMRANAYYDGANKYIGTGYGLLYQQNIGNGTHYWYTAPSGVANGAVTFTARMALDTSGNLGIGTTSPGARLDVNGTLAVGGGIKLPIRTVNASPITVTTSDHTILADAAAGAMTANLPTAASASGYQFTIKKVDSTTATVTIDGNGSETIDGATTAVITMQYESVTVQSNGTNWFIL